MSNMPNLRDMQVSQELQTTEKKFIQLKIGKQEDEDLERLKQSQRPT